jgi:hypothetical protein
MLERTESTINYGQSRDTDNIGHKTQNEYVQNKKLKTLKDKRMSNAYLRKKNSGGTACIPRALVSSPECSRVACSGTELKYEKQNIP